MNGNGFVPHLTRIAAAREETPDVRTLRLEFVEPDVASSLEWRAGQFACFTVFGAGESVFTIANPPSRPGPGSSWSSGSRCPTSNRPA